LHYKRRRENEGGKNRNKRIVMVRLTIQGEKKRCNKEHQVQEPQKVQSFGKSSGVIP
jgi:hypothetical protein